MTCVMAQTGMYYDDTAQDADCSYAMWNHLSGLLSLTEIPLIGVLVTYIVWRVRRDESEFLDDHGREAFNFQVSLALYALMLVILLIPTFGLASIGFLGLLILKLIGIIRGAIVASRGEIYRYPMCIRFV